MTTMQPTTDAPTLCTCGHAPTPDAGCGAGYAIDAETGATRCYGCADSRLVEIIAASTPGKGSALTLYVSTDGRNVTSWTGGVLMTRVKWGAPHSWSGSAGGRRHMTAIDFDGRVWSGVGDEGMWCTLRLTKQVRR